MRDTAFRRGPPHEPPASRARNAPVASGGLSAPDPLSLSSPTSLKKKDNPVNEKELLKLLDFERWRNAVPVPGGGACVGSRRLSLPDLRRLCAREREARCLAIERRRKRKLFPDEDWGEQRQRTRLRRALTRMFRRAKREHRFVQPKLWAGIWRLTVDPERAIQWLFEPGPDPFLRLGGPPRTPLLIPQPHSRSNHEKRSTKNHLSTSTHSHSKRTPS